MLNHIQFYFALMFYYEKSMKLNLIRYPLSTSYLPEIYTEGYMTIHDEFGIHRIWHDFLVDTEIHTCSLVLNVPDWTNSTAYFALNT